MAEPDPSTAAAAERGSRHPAGPVPDAAPSPRGWLARFGSRNHPKVRQERVRMQKARAGMQVSDDTLAAYTAARGFLFGEWFGASLCCASVALVYRLATPGTGASPVLAIGVSLAMFAVGGYAFLSNHRYYQRLDFPWAKRWDTAALIAAGTGAVFWFLFGLLLVLFKMGVDVMPL